MSKFLVVDADQSALSLIENVLLEKVIPGNPPAKNQVVTTCDGLEAFGLLGKHKDIDYIITEIATPGLGGGDLIELLHDTGKVNDMEIIFLSESNDLSILKKDYTKNILGTIKKPFDADSFFERLSELIGQKQAWDEQVGTLRPVWEQQKRLLTSVLNIYIEKTKQTHKINTVLLGTILADYVETEEITPLDELQYSLPVIAYEYAEGARLDFMFDNDRLLCIFNTLVFLETVHEDMIAYDSIKEALEKLSRRNIDDNLAVEQLVGYIFKDASTRIKEEYALLKGSGELDYESFVPFISQAVNFLEQLDCKVHTVEILAYERKIKTALKEIDLIKKSLQNLSETPILKDYSKRELFLKEYSQQLLKILASMKTVVNLSLGKIEKVLWHEAKQSKDIYNYFKKLPRNNTLGSHSLLTLFLKENLIPSNEKEKYLKMAKLFEKREGKNIILVSKDFVFSNMIESAIRINRMWAYQAFTSLEALIKYLEKCQPTILFFDLDLLGEISQEELFAAISKSDTFKKLILGGSTVLVSSRESEGILNLARRLKISNLIKKPVHEGKFVELVNRS